METNVGDTPRIVVCPSWVATRRGAVSWPINPVLGEQFPVLYGYFASTTAGVNGSFISGPGGCGYVHFGSMADARSNTFAMRCTSDREEHAQRQ